MTTFVAWNGNTASLAALDWAIAREYLLDGHVILGHVAGSGSAAPGELVALEDFAARLQADRDGIRVTAELFHGDPAEQLERRCGDGTLLIVGTDTRNEHPRRFELSLGMRLTQRGTVPVVIVPIDARRGAAGVVVGVDGSASSLAALDFAAAEAAARDEPLVVVRTWRLRPVDEDGTLVSPERADAEAERYRGALASLLDPVQVRHPSLRADLRVVHGDAARGLLRAAREAALLVLGTDDSSRGTPGPERVDHAAVMAMHTPIAVIPAAGSLGSPHRAGVSRPLDAQESTRTDRYAYRSGSGARSKRRPVTDDGVRRT